MRGNIDVVISNEVIACQTSALYFTPLLQLYWTARLMSVLRNALCSARPCRKLPWTATSRSLSSHAIEPSSAYFDRARASDPSVTSTPADLTPAQRDVLDASLRVDQAGELAADYIYRGQLAVLRRDPTYGPIIQASHRTLTSVVAGAESILLQEMWDQEKKHLAVMNLLRVQHDVRPTALWEVAKIAGFGLGAVSALMGREAAMACTEAVETVIGEHYDECVSSPAPDAPLY